MMRNYGISFGQVIPGILWINSLLILILFIWFIRSKNWRLLPIIVGGMLNLVERWRMGFVSDYWRIAGTNLYNNFNDWLIFGGVTLCIWHYLQTKKLK